MVITIGGYYYWEKAENTAKHPTTYRVAQGNEERRRPKRQQGGGEDTLA